MTATRSSLPTATASAGAVSRPVAGLPASGQRRPALITVGVVLAVLAAFATIRLVVGAGGRVEVLAVARDVPAFAVLTAQDVRVVLVAVEPGIDTVAAADAAAVVGRVAASALPAGSLLAPRQLSDTRPPGPGEALVGLPMKADGLPAGGVVAGDLLRVVEVVADGVSTDVSAPSFAARVVRLGAADVHGVSVLDVVVDAADGEALAVLAGSGRFALVLLPEDGAGS